MVGRTVILRRVINGMRRIATGLPPAGEAVWPGVRNDLFVAHESVYHFAARFVANRRVLDAACGTGYGSDILAASGATEVLGIDIDSRRIAYAARHHRRPNLEYRVGDCAALDLPAKAFDFIVSSNTLEHLDDPAAFLASAADLLVADGELLVVVPPVLSAADLAEHANNRHHVSSLSVRAWAELFAAGGWSLRFFSHRSDVALDFGSPLPSHAAVSDFAFIEEPLSAAYVRAPLSAAYLLRRAV